MDHAARAIQAVPDDVATAAYDCCSQVAEERWCVLPIVMQAVNVGDGHLRKFFIRHIGQAAEIDPVHFSDRRFSPHAEAAHAAVLTEKVMLLPGVEQILRQL